MSYLQKNELVGCGLDGIWTKKVVLQLLKKEKKKEKERLDEYNKRNEISSEKGTYPLDEDSSSH